MVSYFKRYVYTKYAAAAIAMTASTNFRFIFTNM